MKLNTEIALNKYIRKESESMKKKLDLLKEQLNEWKSVDEEKDIILKITSLDCQSRMLLDIIHIIEND